MFLYLKTFSKQKIKHNETDYYYEAGFEQNS